MNHQIRLYVGSVCAAASLAVAGLYWVAPRVPPEAVTAVAVLSGLAIVAELLGFLLPSAARGSIAFIPYLAAVFLAPSWVTIAAVVVVKAVSDRLAGAQPIKAAFNVAQHALALTLAIFAYRALEGQSFLSFPTASLAHLTGLAGLATFV